MASRTASLKVLRVVSFVIFVVCLMIFYSQSMAMFYPFRFLCCLLACLLACGQGFTKPPVQLQPLRILEVRRVDRSEAIALGAPKGAELDSLIGGETDHLFAINFESPSAEDGPLIHRLPEDFDSPMVPQRPIAEGVAYGSDFSGMDVPGQVVEELCQENGIPFVHSFNSDVAPECRCFFTCA